MSVPTVSIIDDDSFARDGIKDLVASLGYRTITFASAEEFLASGCVEGTTCVISDLQMPGLSGLDLQQRLADQPRRPRFILVTAYPDDKSRSRALNAGAYGPTGFGSIFCESNRYRSVRIKKRKAVPDVAESRAAGQVKKRRVDRKACACSEGPPCRCVGSRTDPWRRLSL